MRNFIGALLAVLTAGEFHKYTAIPEFTSDGVTMSGNWTETYDNMDGNEKVTIYTTFRTGGQKWITGNLVQNYFSIEDSIVPGLYQTFTCSSVYQRTNSYTTNVTVNNYYGNNQWLTTSGDGNWTHINVADKHAGGWNLDLNNA